MDQRDEQVTDTSRRVRKRVQEERAQEERRRRPEGAWREQSPRWVPYAPGPQTRTERLKQFLLRYAFGAAILGAALAVVVMLFLMQPNGELGWPADALYGFYDEVSGEVSSMVSGAGGAGSAGGGGEDGGQTGGEDGGASQGAASSIVPTPYDGEATVTITSEPEGALVTIDRDTLGTTPIEGAAYAAGVRVVTVQRGAARVDSVVILRSDRPLAMHLQLDAAPSLADAAPVEEPAADGSGGGESAAGEDSTSEAVTNEVAAGEAPPAGGPPATNEPAEAMPSPAERSDAEPPDVAAGQRVRSFSEPPGAEADVPSGAEAAQLARSFERFRQRAEARLAEGDLEGARRMLDTALDYQPDNESAQRMLEELDERIVRTHIDSIYTHHRTRGDNLFQQERYAMARLAYEKALRVRPQDRAVAALIAQVDRALTQLAEQRRQYQRYRAQGDAHFEAQRYREAADSYAHALSYQPEDAYVQERLEESRRRAEAQPPPDEEPSPDEEPPDDSLKK